MSECSIRNIGHITEDRISELPVNIHETILCLLPIQDAVRTTVLSAKWRHCWTKIPHLIFDHRFSCLDKILQYRDSQVKANKLVSVINKVLLLHNGPILKFSLTLPQRYGCDSQIVHEFIDQWIPLFSRNGIKQLILQEDDECGEFTAHNFSSLNLTHLRFTRGLFPYKRSFGGYTNLRILELVLVISNYRQDIYDCLVLEKLSLIYCTELFLIHFRAPNLKCLHQAYSEITLEYILPGLENLTEYSCHLTESPIYVEDPILQTETSNAVKVLGNLHKIEKLSIGEHFLQYLAAGGFSNRLSRPLPYLRTLNLSNIQFADFSEFSCLVCLIRGAPNLCKLHILHTWRIGEEEVEEDLEDFMIEDSTLNHLEFVTFNEFRGLEAEVKLVRFLLGHSPLLKTMSIHPSERVKEVVGLAMAKEILQYPRASSRVQIRELEHPVLIDDFDLELWELMLEKLSILY